MIARETHHIRLSDGFVFHDVQIVGHFCSHCGQKVTRFAPVRCLGNKQVFNLKQRQYLRDRFQLCRQCWWSWCNTKEGRKIISAVKHNDFS